jgi:FAD/FMN-containing dehydrogenase
MIVTVSGDVTLDSLQKHIARNGQWLPIDPPSPETVTIETLLSKNLSGPRRYGFGTIRDYTVGIAAVLADGRVIHSGGKVVKNVAGYDLQKLFIGGEGTLGKIVEATFKLRPVPEGEMFFQKECSSLAEAGKLIEEMLDLDFLVLDLRWPHTVIIGINRENMGKSGKICPIQPCTLDYDAEFRGRPGIQKVSVLPSKLIETLEKLGNRPFVARAGNGIIYYDGPPIQVDKPVLPRHLFQRVKDAYDPSHRLPGLST